MNSKKLHKPIEIINFDDVFQTHPYETYINAFKRKKIFETIDCFTSTSEVKSPYLIVEGESGIGKTALLANYIYSKNQDRREEFIYYFIKNNTSTATAQTFIEHIYYSLCWKYKLGEMRFSLNKPISSIELKNLIWQISKNELKNGKFQVIIIDALDESFEGNYIVPIESILQVLNVINFPNNYRIIISSSRAIRGIQAIEISRLYNEL